MTSPETRAYIDDLYAQVLRLKAGIGEAAHVNSVASANYTVLDDDGYAVINVTTGASDRTITLPTAAANTNRTIRIRKVDTGAGKLIVDGEGAELVNGLATMEFWYGGNYVDLECDGTGWIRVGGTVDVSVTPALIENAYDPLDTNNRVVSAAGSLPVGCKQARGWFRQTGSAAGATVQVRTTSGGTAYSQSTVPVAGTRIDTPFQVPLDSSLQFAHRSSNANITDVSVTVTGGLYE